MSKKSAKPKFCTIPDCFSCPYKDCRYSQLTIEEYVEQNRRDREHEERRVRGEYQQRSFDNSGRNEYYRKYYQEHREEMSRSAREWRRRTHYKDETDRRDYYKKYYQTHREEMLKRAKDRHNVVMAAIRGTPA